MTLFEFIEKSPTAFHAVNTARTMLEEAGYVFLPETEAWALQRGGKYFTTRNDSSLIAFRVPEGGVRSLMLTAAHGDSPSFKIKENSELSDGHTTRLSVEKYGGMLCAPWMDRLLSIAGRVSVKTDNGFETRLVDLKEPCAIIPNVAIHMNRAANDGTKYNYAVDMLPVCAAKPDFSLKSVVARSLNVKEENLLTEDLFLYLPEKGVSFGDLVTAPRLDDLECAYATLAGFLASKDAPSMSVYCLFDNEEVGSQTGQGAASTFLPDTLTRLFDALGLSFEDRCRALASSLMLSCDNAHAVHPNHPEFSDKNHSVYLNGGIVIKYNAQQKYTTDAVSSALFRLICDRAGVPYQLYANRADLPGGSTLGNIANTQVSLSTVDIGLAQWAMHSCLETAGAKDADHMVRACKTFFESTVTLKGTERVIDTVQ